jgi:hypothetical protein
VSDERVISLAERLERKPPIEVERRPWDGCRHEAITISEDLRVVDCRECSARIDAIDALIMLARRWSRWQDEYKRLHEERVGYAKDQREKWERRRDRHLNAHPDHALDPDRSGWKRGQCVQCRNLDFTMPQDVKALMREPAP